VKKILTILGARPQFIKASVVSKAIKESAVLHEVILHTGQHFDANMSDVFFAELGMRAPNHNLAISGGRHGDMTGRMLGRIEEILIEENPDAVLVYGDTNSTLAGALAAVKLHIPVAHVEAGLRSFNERMPEEINRVLTDRISRWRFAPTETAVMHLRNEGCRTNSIFHVGDVMFDVALQHGTKVTPDERILPRLGCSPGNYALVTVHRAENTDNPCRLATIVEALKRVAQSLSVVWPVHPRTRRILQELGITPSAQPNLHLIDPVGYLDMVQLEKYAAVIATDSGGVQKEAFFHGVPCVTLRDETEWVELVQAGWNRLAPLDESDQLANTIRMAMDRRGANILPYGDGNSSRKIASILETALLETA
jgi:UDP-GlcNAc3NAcA epimerase